MQRSVVKSNLRLHRCYMMDLPGHAPPITNHQPMGFPGFHPLVARWFRETLGAPTSAQERGWAAIRDGRHTLIAAPTGSGKTLAAFLTAIDDLVQKGLPAPLPEEVLVDYATPLKALSTHCNRPLAEPTRGIRELA